MLREVRLIYLKRFNFAASYFKNGTFRYPNTTGSNANIPQAGDSTMNIDELLPSAKDIRKQSALKEAEKAEEHMRLMAAAEAEKRALIDELTKPSGLSEDEKVKRASAVIQRAVRNGLHEVLVYRFPNALCTDHGRAINQQEAGWENTLTGVPKEIYQLWKDYLQPRGYRLSCQIIDFPGGIPGDIGMTLSWS
jgi:hypothetical protein